MTAKLIVFYKAPLDPAKFDKYYFETHILLAQKMPYVNKAEISRFTGENPPYYLMATLYFNSPEDREASLNSPEGQAAAADVSHFASADSVIFAFADVV
jgi:uncharacterized protein (TIGR02118 family)